MQWVEAAPIPEECKVCTETDCYNCDYAGKRWSIEKRTELQLKRKGILKSIARLEKRLETIDDELSRICGE